MRIKDNYMLREVAGSYVVVPVGKASEEFKGLINLNEVGAFLWKNLKNDTTEEELVIKLMKEYEVDEKTATNDVHNFIQKLIEANLVTK